MPHDVIGIRPGEKLHELLITSDEARHTIDAGDVYLVLPEHPWWDEMGPSAVGKAVRRRLRLRERHQRRVALDRRAPLGARRVGAAHRPMIDIPYGRQSIDDDDIAAVVDVLRGDWLTQGPAVERFEAALCAVTEADARGRVRERHRRAARDAVGRRRRQGRPRRHVAALVRAPARAARSGSTRSPAFVDIDPKTLNLDLGIDRPLRRAGRRALRGPAGRPGIARDPAPRRDRGRRARARRPHARRSGRQLRALRRVRVLVPPGEDRSPPARAARSPPTRPSSRPGCAASGRTGWCPVPSRAAGTTRSPSSRPTRASPTCSARSARRSSPSSSAS